MKNIVRVLFLVIWAGQLFAQTPLQVNCPGSVVTFCDISPNSISLWNETYWYDPQNDIDDLPEAPTFCETYVIITDGTHACPNEVQQITTCFNFWKDGSPMQVELDLPGTTSVVYDSLGCLVATLNVSTPANYTVTPVLDTDPLNGVNALDLIRISQHILGLRPLGVYAQNAADLNKSGSITTFDIVELKKLLVGIYATLPNNSSWRFVDANFQFPNPANPFQTGFPENGTEVLDSSAHFAFIGVKIGDVDGSAYPGLVAPNEDRATAIITLPDVTLLTGETIELPLRIQTDGDWLGLQMGLHFDAELLEIAIENTRNLPGWDVNSWSVPQPGILQLAWFDVEPQYWLPEEEILTLRIKALAPVRLREALGLRPKDAKSGLASAVVNAASEIQPLQLAFTTPIASNKAANIFAPQPNPLGNSALQFPLRLQQDETVRLQLTDLTGRILFQSEQMLVAGSHFLVIPATTFPQNGIYIWRIEAGNRVVSGKVVKNK